MGIDQLVNAYKGNPQPLQAKVQKAQQGQPPGAIPPDLEEAIALQKITELRNSAQNQQAMQAGGAQPSVVEKLRQMLSAEQRQQAQPPQMPQNPQEQPQGQPQGQPQMAQPPQQPPQGVDALPTNVGQQYAEGGIIGNVRHFDEGGKTSIAGDFFRSLADSIMGGIQQTADYGKARAEREKATPGLFEALTQQEREDRLRKAREAARQERDIRETGGAKAPYPEAGPAIPGPWDRPSGKADEAREVSKFIRQTPGVIEAIYEKEKSESKPRVNAAAAAGGGESSTAGSGAPGVPRNLSFTPSAGVGNEYMRKMLDRDEDALAGEMRAKFLNEVGKKDLSVYDEMAAELKARKERLKGPEKGFDSLMEYLGQIAQSGGGRSWMEAGAKGAAGLSALQKARQDQQDALVDKILDLGAKKKEAEYGERLGMFNLTKTERDKIIQDKRAVAEKLGLSEDKERELIQNALLEEAKMKNQMAVARMGGRDNLAERAAKIRAENPGMSFEESIRRASLAGSAASVGGTDVRRDKAYIDAKNKIDERFQHLISDTPYGKKQKELYDKAISDLNATFGISGGINTLPAAAQTIPTGAKPSDLIVGTVYQTARGPAKWNGKAFDPVQ